MEIDKILKKAKEFIIIVEEKEHIAQLIDIGKKGELFFELSKDSKYGEGELGLKGSVLFRIGNINYFFQGKVFNPTPSTMIVVRETEIFTDRRSEVRFETQSLPAKVKEHGILHSEIIQVYVLNLTPKGVCFETHEKLDEDKKYSIEIPLEVKYFSKTVYANFKIKYVKEKQNFYIYGAEFENISEEEKNKINRYILLEKDKWEIDYLNA